jgi:hypothetical protein
VEDDAMLHDRQSGTRLLGLIALFVLALCTLPGIAFASKEPKTYPEEGKVMAMGLNEWVVNRQHQYSHTYTVVTNTKSYLLECGHRPVFGSMGEECGGSKKLQIGDVIHFRIDKNQAYIPITKIDNSAAEEKLHVLSTALKPDTPTETPQASAEKTAPKPPGPS